MEAYNKLASKTLIDTKHSENESIGRVAQLWLPKEIFDHKGVPFDVMEQNLRLGD